MTVVYLVILKILLKITCKLKAVLTPIILEDAIAKIIISQSSLFLISIYPSSQVSCRLS